MFPLPVVPSLDFTRCILCGSAAAVPVPIWMDMVRVLHPRNGAVELSGLVTRYHEVTLGIKSSESVRWAIAPSDGEETWGSRDCPHWPAGQWFIIHDRCWQFMMSCFGPRFMGIEKLYDMLRTMPPPRDSSFLQVFDYYPCIPLAWQEILNKAQDAPRPSCEVKRRLGMPHQSDPFRGVPLEIRHGIARLLTMRDFLALRHTSRAMAALFEDAHFWKSRFEADGDRAYLHHLVWDRPEEEPQINWRLLYHASAKVENRFESTVFVWETVRWIQDAHEAEQGLRSPPLEYYGRALQDYHNDTCAVTRRLQRVDVSDIAKVEATLIPVPSKPNAVAEAGEFFTAVVALDLINGNGARTTIGSKDVEADASNTRKLFQELRGEDGLQYCMDSAGVHVLADADSLVGFRMGYDPTAIYWMAVLTSHHTPKVQPAQFGRGPGSCSVYEVGLDKVTQIVATFEGRRLVDLGLRGWGKRNPISGNAPFFSKEDIDYERYHHDPGRHS